MDTTLKDRESKVTNFMDEVEKIKNSKSAEEMYQQTPEYKLKQIKNEKEKAKGVCLDAIFSKIYKDAIPMNDEYKVSHGDDLDSEFSDFINMRNHKGMEYYIKEAIKRGSEPAKKIMEAVEQLIKEEYHDKELNINSTDSVAIPFEVDSDSVQSKLQSISSDMNLPEITDIIKDNVKTQTIDDIERVKQEEENIKSIQEELASNPDITSESAIDRALKLKGIGLKKEYNPSLFEGIMINKTNMIKESVETQNVFTEVTSDELIVATAIVGVTAGIALNIKQKKQIKNLFKIYEKLNPNCIPFSRFTIEPYQNDEVRKLGIKPEKGKHADKCKFKVFKYNNKTMMYISFIAYASGTDYSYYDSQTSEYSKSSTISSGHNTSSINDIISYKHEFKIKDASCNKYSDYYIACMAYTQGFGHPALNRFIDKMKPILKANKKLLKESVESQNESFSLYNDSINKLAFVESVKELTKWNIVSTFNLEKIDKVISKKIANDYATGKINY